MFVGAGLTGGLTLFGKIVVALAVSFVVGAIMKALFKPPKRGEPTTTKSYLMRGSANRTAQGVAVPVGYGTLKIGSTNISQDRIVRRLKQQNNQNKEKDDLTASYDLLNDEISNIANKKNLHID